MDDKLIEQKRYNKVSEEMFSLIENDNLLLRTLGPDNFPLYLQTPYLLYHNLIAKNTSSASNQLDLCCGNGMHSFTGAINGASVIALDYAEKSITICKKRAELLNVHVDFKTADVQVLFFKDNFFDVVTCAGSLSYLDNKIFLEEIFRVLKKDGIFICVDSFNHNLFYRANRYFHYLKGNRTYSTLKRMPNEYTIDLFKSIFTEVEVSYHGIFIFLVPIMKLFYTDFKIKKIVDQLDNMFPFLKRYAFKVVISAKK